MKTLYKSSQREKGWRGVVVVVVGAAAAASAFLVNFVM
jgi:hypothetical protein